MCLFPQDFVTVARDAPPVLADFFARQNDACIEAFRTKGTGDGNASPPQRMKGSEEGGGMAGDDKRSDGAESSSGPCGDSAVSSPTAAASCTEAVTDSSSSRSAVKSNSSTTAAATSTTVISFSHFVPRQELCPEKRFLSEPNLTKVIHWLVSELISWSVD